MGCSASGERRDTSSAPQRIQPAAHDHPHQHTQQRQQQQQRQHRPERHGSRLAAAHAHGLRDLHDVEIADARVHAPVPARRRDRNEAAFGLTRRREQRAGEGRREGIAPEHLNHQAAFGNELAQRGRGLRRQRIGGKGLRHLLQLGVEQAVGFLARVAVGHHGGGEHAYQQSREQTCQELAPDRSHGASPIP
jgi:hypothetical protein